MDLFSEPLKFSKIVFQNEKYFPKEINHCIDKLSLYLENNYLSDSPFIYLISYNHIKTIISYFSIIKINRICVLVDPNIKKIEFGEMKVDTPPGAIITINMNFKIFDYNSEITFFNNPVNINKKDTLSDVCTMKYSAAEDGFSKAVMLTKKNLLSNARAILECDTFNANSVSCALVPFNNLYGLQTGILAPLLGGVSILIKNISLMKNYKELLSEILTNKVTNIYSIPLVYYLLAKVPNIDEYVKETTTFVSGGYILSPKIFHSFFKKTGKYIRNGYGLTEASPICTWHKPGDEIKISSMGRPFSNCQIRIYIEKKGYVESGTMGEICVKGPNIMKGYYNCTSFTKKTIRNGWLHTGDLGKIDKEGYIYFAGLKKNMLNVGGKNIYPAEVERLIKLHKNVKDVKIYGEYSEIYSHRVKAEIKLKKNSPEHQEKFAQWCKDNISGNKIPKFINFV